MAFKNKFRNIKLEFLVNFQNIYVNITYFLLTNEL